MTLAPIIDPSTASGAIVLGVLSGALWSAITQYVIAVWQSRVTPLIQRWKYTGLEVQGAWEGIGDSQRVSFALQQSATQLSGSATLVAIDEDHKFEPVRHFTLTGTVQDRFVVLNFRHKDRDRIGVGTFVLEISGDGRKMQGCWSFFSVASDSIVSSPIVLYRPSALPPSGSDDSEQLEILIGVDESSDDDGERDDDAPAEPKRLIVPPLTLVQSDDKRGGKA